MKNMLNGALTLALIFVMLFGCKLSSGASTNQIGETVKKSMQQKFDSDSPFKEWGLKVTTVQVQKQGETQYKGTATMLYQGESHEVPVDITVNGSDINWKVQPGGFAFAEQK